MLLRAWSIEKVSRVYFDFCLTSKQCKYCANFLGFPAQYIYPAVRNYIQMKTNLSAKMAFIPSRLWYSLFLNDSSTTLKALEKQIN